jgi:hypothetical protein
LIEIIRFFSVVEEAGRSARPAGLANKIDQQDRPAKIDQQD